MTQFRHGIDPIELGQTLVERAVDVYIVDGIEIISRWYNSTIECESGCDLMVWLDSENELIRFQFNISGQIVDWNRANGFRSGLIVEIEGNHHSSRTSGMGAGSQLAGVTYSHATAETIRYDVSPSLSAVRMAQSVFLAADSIRTPWRERVVRLLSFDGTSNTKQPAIPRRRAHRSRFWRRLRGWVIGT